MRLRELSFTLLLVTQMVACGGGSETEEGGAESTPSAESAAGSGDEGSTRMLPTKHGVEDPAELYTDDGPLRFTDITADSGLGAFVQSNGHPDKLYIQGSIGAGVALFDYDQDGDLDAYLSNGTSLARDAATGGPADALYANVGGARFEDRTAALGLGDRRWTFGVTAVDLDGDSWTDLYIANYGPNVFYTNRSGEHFEDTSEAMGGCDDSWTSSSAFFDFDRDGDLDLYTSNYVSVDRAWMIENRPRQDYKGVSVFKGPRGLDGAPDRFWVNDGSGRLEERTEEVGVGGVGRYGFEAVPFDYDGDGWLDLYVANDSEPNLLWHNVAGEGGRRFEDVAVRAGLALSAEGVAQAGMGVTMGDFDQDLDLDIYVTNFADDYFTLYRNDGRFYRDVTRRAQLSTLTTSSLGWSCGFVDLDNDGDLDLFTVNGHVYPQVDLFEVGTKYRQRNLLFENRGGGRFARPEGLGGSGFALKTASRGGAFGDIDNDGDLDLLIGNIDEAPTLLRNDSPNIGNWVKVLPLGTGGNREAVGARMVLTVGDRKLLRVVGSEGGFLSSSDPRESFGLGTATKAEALEITWPDGSTESIGELQHGHLVTVLQGQGVVSNEVLEAR